MGTHFNGHELVPAQRDYSLTFLADVLPLGFEGGGSFAFKLPLSVF